MKISADLMAFAARIGHSFRKPELLVRAVTHASMGSSTRRDNQRQEVRGDRVRGRVMAEALRAGGPKVAEGWLAGRGKARVRKETCGGGGGEVGLG